MSEHEIVATPPLKNRRPGLIGCGVVHLLLGLGFIVFSASMVLMLAFAPHAAQGPVPAGMVYTNLFLYLVLAALFLVLGIGSMIARRWAPPLIQVTSWAWLIGGVVTSGMMALLLPQILAPLPKQPGVKAFVVGIMAVGIGLFGIALPLTFILFYRSAHVRATVERLDPVPRWTDRQPLALLAFASWMFFAALSVLLSSFMYRGLPIGGFMLRGRPMLAVMVAMATLLVWIAVGTLRRLPAAWWTALTVQLIGMAWSALFLMSADFDVMFEAMGLPPDPQQAALSRALHSSPFFYGWIAVVWVGHLAFLLYIRRYFVRADRGQALRRKPPAAFG